ncbi:MAG: ribose 5-phosphate isomerase B [Candidatus Margulisbacteria bacterium]|nr:ribose 5-phosphate isomerase B [Candidatus Margulisiibacteriota bacterium]MBU1021631.1 ribose 5-phosphate isomerase B [Candidatus Margulisiibacteriota bacterium]MBU1728781.1 ribose 5-phosphate isomerase B [Candidatus Margulisiibacteriota bacterium]MBU1955747.1 ribose 5-phosphate isomerase B [Candidatus Margulisiibacteriota bacterium]
MKIAIGSDHGGYELKEYLKKYLARKRHQTTDFGTFNHDSVDYPDIAKPVGRSVAKKDYHFGILICGTGIGICIAANKVPGIRAAVCHNVYTSQMAREHNDANVLCLGGRVVTKKMALNILKIFLKTKFAGGRHLRRVRKIGR